MQPGTFSIRLAQSRIELDRLVEVRRGEIGHVRLGVEGTAVDVGEVEVGRQLDCFGEVSDRLRRVVCTAGAKIVEVRIIRSEFWQTAAAAERDLERDLIRVMRADHRKFLCVFFERLPVDRELGAAGDGDSFNANDHVAFTQSGSVSPCALIDTQDHAAVELRQAVLLA